MIFEVSFFNGWTASFLLNQESFSLQNHSRKAMIYTVHNTKGRILLWLLLHLKAVLLLC